MQWIGSREVAFILANAPDLPAPPPDWLAKARTKIFQDPVDGADLSSYITAVSYNKASLTGNIFGPYTTNAKRPDGSWDLGEATGRIINAARTAGVVPGIKYFCVIFTDHRPAPAWAFYSSSGGSCYVDMIDGLGVIAMENLHVITQFGDLYGIPDSPDAFDVMACSCGTHPSSFTKIELGWVDPDTVITVPMGTPSRSITLHALGSSVDLSPTPNRAHGIMVPTSVSSHYYLIEARLRVDRYERTTPRVSTGIPGEGVVVYWIDRSSWPPVHLRAVLSGIGSTFVDQQSWLEVSITASVALGFTVEIKRPKPGRWDNWHQLGVEEITSGPAVCSWAPGRLDVFARGTDNTLYTKSWDGSRWDHWHQLGGEQISSDPAAVSWGPNRIDVFARGTDNTLYTKSWDGNHWDNWHQLGVEEITSGPAVCSWAPGRLDVFARGTDNTLYTKSWDGSRWDHWHQLGGEQILSDPAAVSWGPNRIDVFARGTDNTLYTKSWDGNHWDNWHQLGVEEITSGPVVCSWAPGRLDVFARGTDNTLYTKSWDGSRWDHWHQLGGEQISSDPAAVSWGPNRIDVFARGTDNTLYTKSWDGPESIECYQFRSQIASFSDQVGQLEAAKQGLDPRNPVDLREIHRINGQIAQIKKDINRLRGEATAMRCLL